MSERSFENLNIDVYKVGPPSLIKVDWVWKDSVIPLSRYLIDIYRGESPEGMEKIAQDLRADVHSFYEDFTARLKDKHRIYYYKVVAKNIKSGKTVETKPVTWEGELDFVGLYIVEEHDFLFRWVSGIPCLVYKKQTDGEVRCPDCWDSIAKRVKKSNCKTCHGTGWTGSGVGGYYNPSYIWADYSPDPEVIEVAQWGRVQPTQTDVMMTNYPDMSVGDVVIELPVNKRYKVSNVRDTEKNRTNMLQIVRLDAVEKNDIEYKIPVEDYYVEKARKELNERKQIREF